MLLTPEVAVVLMQRQPPELGEKWRLAEIQRQNQRNALLLERVTDLMKNGFSNIVANQPTGMTQRAKGKVPPFGVKQTPSPSSTGEGKSYEAQSTDWRKDGM